VLLRHGQSLWNEEDRFTGWTDVDLSKKGINEARAAAQRFKQEDWVFDVAHTSVLKRAIKTLWIVLEGIDRCWTPTHCSWRLNERHYGALQGLNKAETTSKYGAEQVFLWRRSFDVRPPTLDETDPRYQGRNLRYRELVEDYVPRAESLRETMARLLPYWREVISPTVASGKIVLIVAHGNSLRALVKHLDHIPDEEIPDLYIPTGIPLVYELDADLVPTDRFYLGTTEEVEQATQSIRAGAVLE
jgi:2,3-bisphosphoglycerate-dependent phosphoglycerate mutase